MHQRRPKLLLVDGELTRAEKLARRLAHLEYDIRVAENGALGLLAAHEMRPDVIVTAEEMPVLDGCLMLEGLRSKQVTRGIPVILLTEDLHQERLSRAWRAGAYLCIPRNTGEADVIATLNRALEGILGDEHSTHALTLVS